MEITRRSALRLSSTALGLGVAGCTASSPPESDASPTTPAESSTSSAPAETTTHSSPKTSGTVETMETTSPSSHTLAGKPFTKLRVEPTPADSPFQHSVKFLAQPNSDHPARIRITIRNASKTAQTIQTDNWKLPFPSPLAESHSDTGLVISQNGDPSMTDGCWRDYAKSYPMVDTRTLAAGDTLTKQYGVANWMKNDTCWPTGEYAFTQGYTVNPGSDEYSYGWGFTLVLEQ